MESETEHERTIIAVLNGYRLQIVQEYYIGLFIWWYKYFFLNRVFIDVHVNIIGQQQCG